MADQLEPFRATSRERAFRHPLDHPLAIYSAKTKASLALYYSDDEFEDDSSNGEDDSSNSPLSNDHCVNNKRVRKWVLDVTDANSLDAAVRRRYTGRWRYRNRP